MSKLGDFLTKYLPFTPFAGPFHAQKAFGQSLPDILNSASKNFINQYTGNGLTDAQVQEYNLSEQAADNALVRSKDLYNSTQSYQAQTDQMIEAGLNPAMMYQNGIGNGATPSGPQATSPTAQPVGFTDLVRSLSQADRNIASAEESRFKVKRGEALLPAEFDKIWAECKTEGERANALRNQALSVAKEAGWIDMMNQAALELRVAEKAYKESETDVNKQQIKKIETEIRKINVEIGKTFVETENIKTLTEMYKVDLNNKTIQGAREALQLEKDCTEVDFLIKLYESGYMDQLKEAELNDLLQGIKLKRGQTFERYTHGAKNITGAANDVNEIVSTWLPAPGKLLRGSSAVSRFLGRNGRNGRGDSVMSASSPSAFYYE